MIAIVIAIILESCAKSCPILTDLLHVLFHPKQTHGRDSGTLSLADTSEVQVRHNLGTDRCFSENGHLWSARPQLIQEP